MTIVTLDDMAKAIANRTGIDMEEARRDAGFVMDYFGFDDRIIDNVLDPEDRQLFYILEEEGLLSTSKEVIYLSNGSSWRSYFWEMEKDNIKKHSQGHIIPIEKIPLKQQINIGSPEKIYDSLKDEMWKRPYGEVTQINFSRPGL